MKDFSINDLFNSSCTYKAKFLIWDEYKDLADVFMLDVPRFDRSAFLKSFDENFPEVKKFSILANNYFKKGERTEEVDLWECHYNNMIFYMFYDCSFTYSPRHEETLLELFKKIQDKAEEYILPVVEKVKRSTINLLIPSPNGLDTRCLDLNQSFDSDFIETHYNEDFQEVHNRIVDKLENDHKGLVLLHGLPGTGKSTYIKYLCEKFCGSVIYIPPDMARELSNPNLISFLMDNRDTILIVEDAESILKTRSETSTQAVANILNLSDGILSDCLGIRLVCTFNTDLENIDQALLRAGRLIANYEFKKLDVEKADKLLHSRTGENTTAPMTLAEIYNR